MVLTLGVFQTHRERFAFLKPRAFHHLYPLSLQLWLRNAEPLYGVENATLTLGYEDEAIVSART